MGDLTTLLDTDLESEQGLRLALETARGRLRLLTAHSSGVLLELDQAGRFVRVWASDPQMLARPEPELLGKTVSDVLGPEVGAFHDKLIREALESGKGREYEYELTVPTGLRQFTASSAVVSAGDDTERTVIVWIRDVTEQVQARAKLLHTERLAALGRLAGGVAHEVNNPLGYMLLNVDRMQRQIASLRAASGTDAKTLDELEQARVLLAEGCARVRKIVRELTNFARVEGPLKRIQLPNIIELALDHAHVDECRHIQVVRHFEPVPEVMADESRLVQVFLRIIDNAVYALRPSDRVQEVVGRGGSELRVTTDTDSSGRAVAIVADTGRGMSPDVKQRIFEPFYSTKPEGVGLGLALCQTILTSLGGELTVESELGAGTTVRVVLPSAHASF